MQQPLNQLLSVQQGATFRCSFAIVNPDGTPTNLTDVTAKMQVRLNYTSTTPVLTLSSPSNGISVGQDTNNPNYIDVVITAVQTAAISVVPSLTNTTGQPYKDYVYDLFITLPSGDEYKQAYGVFMLNGSVTDLS